MLAINKLSVSLISRSKKKILLNDISFSISKNQVVGVVGESGSGKSLTALSILRLLNNKTFNTSGNIFFNNTDILNLNINQVQKIRGNKIAMIFQEPMSALNPTMNIGDQLIEICERHLTLTKKEILEKIKILIQKVKLDHIKNLTKKYQIGRAHV